jgi:hypothetical protein
LIENNKHLFACKHPGQQAIIETLLKNIDKNNLLYGVNELTEIIKMAIRRTDMKEQQPQTADKQLLTCIRDQQEIGWEHIMFGRIAKTTSQFIDVTLQQRGVQKWQNSGERWSQRMIQNIWDSLLSLWNNRNAIIYNSHTMNKQDIMRDRLKMKVERCYSYADTLKLLDRQLLFHLTENELMAEDP